MKAFIFLSFFITFCLILTANAQSEPALSKLQEMEKLLRESKIPNMINMTDAQ